MSGVTRQSYSPEIRIIRLMCTGRVDLSFVFRALERGADGVIIGGCWPGECHYVTEGNYDALGNMHLCKLLLEHIGLSPERLRLEWIAASEGSRFAEIMSNFVETIRELGPLGSGEGIGETGLKFKLKAVTNMVPYLKLVEREKLRVPSKSEEAYNDFYHSDEVARLFSKLVADRLVMSQIRLLLDERPLSTREIAETLDITPSEASRYLNTSSRQGVIRYDVNNKCYTPA